MLLNFNLDHVRIYDVGPHCGFLPAGAVIGHLAGEIIELFSVFNFL